MKNRLRVAAALSAAALLTSCGSVSTSTAPATAEDAVSTTETAPAETPQPTDAPQTSAGLEDAGYAVLPYDEIRVISTQMDGQTYPEIDYFTMCKDGLWGLIRSDGTEVLPCLAPKPLFECGLTAHSWHGYYDGTSSSPDTDYYTRSDQLNPQLVANGDGRLCDAHDGTGYLFFYYLPGESETLQLYSGAVGPGELSEITDTDWQDYAGAADGIVPTQCGSIVEYDEWYADVELSDKTYTYRHRDGTEAGNGGYTQADYFFGQALAPAERDGKWLYVDTAGQEVTDACYDAIYDDDYWGDVSTIQYQRAMPLLSGYAVVSREGKFGLLDSTGSEYLPCTCDGLVWDGETLWQKQDDGWHAYHIPGVMKTYQTDRMPENITRPDAQLQPGDPEYYTTTQEGVLNLRAGPGTEYDGLEKIPAGSVVFLYGHLSSAPDWALVRYGRQFGWVSTEYLTPPEN